MIVPTSPYDSKGNSDHLFGELSIEMSVDLYKYLTMDRSEWRVLANFCCVVKAEKRKGSRKKKLQIRLLPVEYMKKIKQRDTL